MSAIVEGEDPLNIPVQQSIVDDILGDLLFYPDDVDDQKCARALSIFKIDGVIYQVEEKRVSRFRLVVRFMSRGASFHMAALLMQDTQEETSIGWFGGCSKSAVARYARVVCAVSLEYMLKIISGTWAFSLALDCATHQGKSYIDVRCRFSRHGRLHNFHLLAVPLFDRHTVANIFRVVKRLLDAMLPAWRDQLIGVATDGGAAMVGCLGGLVTLTEAETTHNITRVWCGLHQSDLKMQIMFTSALNETYLSKLTALTGFLRRQQNLISEMGTTCPKVASTRWLSAFQVTGWLRSNRFPARASLEEKMAPCDPNPVWWIFLFALRDIAREANAVFVLLQGLSILVRQQHDRFVGLLNKLCKLSGTLGPLDQEKVAALRSRTTKSTAPSLSHTKRHWTTYKDWICGSVRVSRLCR